jgi:hypothetical protein
MTPKDKALELYFKYEKQIREYKQNSFEYDGRKAKNCCLIAVDEIIKAIGFSTTDEYWQEVKQEIEKL